MLGVQTSNDGSAVSGAPAGFDVSEAQMVERELERASDSDSLQGDQHLVSIVVFVVSFHKWYSLLASICDSVQVYVGMRRGCSRPPGSQLTPLFL